MHYGSSTALSLAFIFLLAVIFMAAMYLRR